MVLLQNEVDSCTCFLIDRKKRTAVYRRRKLEEHKRRLGEVNFLESIQDYQTLKEEVKEKETIEKILNNEKVVVDVVKSENSDVKKTEEESMEGASNMEDNLDAELGPAPDIEIGDM